MCQVLKYLVSSAVTLKNSLKYNFSRDSGPNWTFKCNKKRFNKNLEKLRHRFQLETMTSSKVFYSKKSNTWMLRYKASSWNGHFLGKLVDLSPWKLILKRKRGRDRIRDMRGGKRESKRDRKREREVEIIEEKEEERKTERNREIM